MKNIKVNFTDANGRTSTTINGQICWAYFKQTDVYKNDEGDASFLGRAVQDFVNSIKVERKYMSKMLIEDLLLNHIMSYEFERGMETMQKAINKMI